MKDRFKFRAWDTKNNKFFEPIYEAYNGKLEEFIINQYGSPSIRKIDGVWGVIDEFILMQCTGLKDKNGNLVYEGDIVKSYNDEICEIKFDDDEACFFIASEHNDHPMCNLGFKFTIIGNIYENPELLNKPESEA